MRVLKAILGVGVLLLTVAALAGTWAYFEWMAPVVRGTIVDKQERITGGRQAAPGRYLTTSFTLKDETENDRYLYGSPLKTDIRVDAHTYESAVVGTASNVKYLPINPRIARLEGQPLVSRGIWIFAASILLAGLSLLFKRTRVAAVLCCGFVAAFLVSLPGPPSPRFVLTAAVAMLVVVALGAMVKRVSTRLLVSAWALVTLAALYAPAMQRAAAATSTASAEIRSVSQFQMPKSLRSRYRLTTLQEFDRVHASFVPRGAERPVFLLDFVDHDTAGPLAEGARVTVAYNDEAPESARIQQAARTHYWKNAAVPVGIMLAVTLMFSRTHRTKSRTRSKAQPA